jgi:hypothetical protein
VANIFVAASATWNGKALKKAKQDVGVFDKQVKKLGGTLAAAFSVRALTNFGKASVKMAIESQAEQERLANLLQVTTGARRQQIDALNDQATALEKIGVVTAGSITQTQSQLATFDLQLSTIEKLTPAILDYVTAEKGATASAADFKSMTNGLAQALNGNFASLTKTGFVLDDFTKKTIKEGTETERAAALVKVLNSTYKDFNKNLRQTNAGKMQVLANTANDVKVIIGTGILDALTLLSDDNTIDNLASSMEDFAVATSEVIVGLGKVAEKLKALNVPGIDGSFLRNVSGIGAGLRTIELLRELGTSGVAQQDRGGQERTAFRINTQQRKKEAEIIKNAARARKAELDALNKKNVIENKNLKELEKKFDLERIGLTQALNVATDDETKVRLKAQLAILDQNEAMAKKLLAELEAYEALKKLADAAKTLTTTFEQMIETLRASIRSILDSIKPQLSTLKTLTDPTEQNLRSSVSAILESTKPAQNALQNLINPSEEGLRRTIADSLAAVKPSMDLLNLITSGASIQRTSANSPMDIRLTIDGGSDRLSQAIAESIQVANRSGYSTVPNGFIV